MDIIRLSHGPFGVEDVQCDRDERFRDDDYHFMEVAGHAEEVRFLGDSFAATNVARRFARMLTKIQEDPSLAYSSDFLEYFYNDLGVRLSDLADFDTIEKVADYAIDSLFQSRVVHSAFKVRVPGVSTAQLKDVEIEDRDLVLREAVEFKENYKPLLMTSIYRRALRHSMEWEKKNVEADLDEHRRCLLAAMAHFPRLKEEFGMKIMDFGVDGVRHLQWLKGLVSAPVDEDELEELDVDEDEDQDFMGDDFEVDATEIQSVKVDDALDDSGFYRMLNRWAEGVRLSGDVGQTCRMPVLKVLGEEGDEASV